MSRLTIDLTDRQHQSLKAMAALQGKTIRQYAVERLFPSELSEDQAWEELKTLLARRIGEGLSAGGSGKDVDAVLEDELKRGSSA